MPSQQQRYSKEETARCGDEIYARLIAPQIEAAQRGRIVAIDVATEDFEIDDTGLAACQRILARNSNAQLWCARIGFPYLHRFGRAMSRR
jgi:hypothetical protein